VAGVCIEGPSRVAKRLGDSTSDGLGKVAQNPHAWIAPASGPESTLKPRGISFALTVQTICYKKSPFFTRSKLVSICCLKA